MSFINFSNHNSSEWSQTQIKAAKKWGEIVDLAFPQVSAVDDEKNIEVVAKDYVERIIELKPDAVMCQGEFTLSYMVVSELIRRGIQVVSACSERKSREMYREDGSVYKESVFEFIRFREYKTLSN